MGQVKGTDSIGPANGNEPTANVVLTLSLTGRGEAIAPPPSFWKGSKGYESNKIQKNKLLHINHLSFEAVLRWVMKESFYTCNSWFSLSQTQNLGARIKLQWGKVFK